MSSGKRSQLFFWGQDILNSSGLGFDLAITSYKRYARINLEMLYYFNITNFSYLSMLGRYMNFDPFQQPPLQLLKNNRFYYKLANNHFYGIFKNGVKGDNYNLAR